MKNSINRCKPLLGTYVDIHLNGDATQKSLLDISERAFAVLHACQQRLNFHDAASELNQLNSLPADKPQIISEQLASVLSFALKLSNKTSGLYDVCCAAGLITAGNLKSPLHLPESLEHYGNWQHITLNEQTREIKLERPVIIDLSGIAKGFAIDCALQTIPADIKATINAGGDIVRNHTDISPFYIRHPASPDQAIVVESSAPAMATSSSYFQQTPQYFNPRTQRPVNAVKSWSVFAESGMTADALTKVALLCHEDQNQFEHILDHFVAQALSVDEHGDLHYYPEEIHD